MNVILNNKNNHRMPMEGSEMLEISMIAYKHDLGRSKKTMKLEPDGVFTIDDTEWWANILERELEIVPATNTEYRKWLQKFFDYFREGEFFIERINDIPYKEYRLAQMRKKSN